MAKQVELPDFDEMFNLVEIIKSVSIKKAKLETELAEAEAKVVRTVMHNSDYFIDGKAPSMSYVKVTWLMTGLSDELIPKRQELAECNAILDASKKLLEFYKTEIEVWRTISANERMAVA